MDASSVLDAVRDDRETELSRLGSSKSLFAVTGGEMEREAVLRAAADAASAAAAIYGDWAEAEDDDRARDAFESVAAEDRDRTARIADDLDDYEPGDPPAVYGVLREQSDTAARVGGLLGETLVADRRLGQVVGFFVGDADPRTASTFREMGSTLDDRLDRVTEVLDAVCQDDADYDRARDAADAAVTAAYDEYVDSLEAQGINPKPVC